MASPFDLILLSHIMFYDFTSSGYYEGIDPNQEID